jgi:hypothetical protein
MEMGMNWFEPHTDKMSMRPHLNKKDDHGGAYCDTTCINSWITVQADVGKNTHPYLKNY